VLFHGGVPSGQRGALVDRFHNDPACRVFLSTDAGGVGLNLQHAASVVVNMDLPWNPAVLEQRIGRVHRLGQTRGVQVVNFVAEGTIEEGMLSVLAFKKSLFAGVLDGGAREVFLGGSRLKLFMESVDAVTAASARTASESASPTAVRQVVTAREPSNDATSPLGSGSVPAEALKPSRHDMKTHQPTAPTPPADQDGKQTAAAVWAPLLSAGLKLVQALTAAPAPSGNGSGVAQSAASPWIETDTQTGRAYLKFPMPEPQIVREIGEVLSRLVSSLANRSE
jgi:superfamily II DNA/RNA helicase